MKTLFKTMLVLMVAFAVQAQPAYADNDHHGHGKHKHHKHHKWHHQHHPVHYPYIVYEPVRTYYHPRPHVVYYPQPVYAQPFFSFTWLSH